MPWRSTVVVAVPVIASLLAKTPTNPEPDDDTPEESAQEVTEWVAQTD